MLLPHLFLTNVSFCSAIIYLYSASFIIKKCTRSYFFNSLGKANTGMVMILIAKIIGVMIFHIAIDISELCLFTLHLLSIRKLWEINITW
jgi:hypothetical protein